MRRVFCETVTYYQQVKQYHILPLLHSLQQLTRKTSARTQPIAYPPAGQFRLDQAGFTFQVG